MARMVFNGETHLSHSGIAGGNQVIFAPTYVATSPGELEGASKQMNESVLASLAPFMAVATNELVGDGAGRVIERMKELFRARAVGEDVDVGTEFVRVTLGRDQKPIDLATLWEQDHRRVGLVGEAGAGKTTLMLKIAYDWACGQSLWKTHFDVVVLVRLRCASGDLKGLSMEEVMLRCVLRDDRSWTNDVRAFLRLCKEQKDHSRVLWLLDGWDEIDPDSELQAIKEGLGSDYVQYLLGSGRPGSIMEKERRQQVLVCDTTLTVLGFDEAGIEKFVRQKCPNGAQDVLSAIEGSKWLREACRLPLVLKFVCLVGPSGIRNKTDLYKEVIDLLMDRFVKEKQHQHIASSSRLKVKKSVRKALQELAWFSFERMQTEVSKSRLEELDDAYFVEVCGLLKPADWRRGEVSRFEWLHKSVQEYLAAEHVCFARENAGDSLSRLWAKLGGERGGSVFFRFVCGLGGHAGDCLDEWFPKELPIEEVVLWIDESGESFQTQLLRYRFNLLASYGGAALLCEAAELGLVNTLAFLVKKGGLPVDVSERGGKNALHVACEWGQLEAVVWLLGNGADPCAIGAGGRTLLHSMSSFRGRVINNDSVINLCFPLAVAKDASAMVNAKMGKRHKLTPLHTACDSGYVHLVDLLLRHGADINAKQRNGRTPLHRACEQGRIKVVERLLCEGGLELNVAERCGLTPLHMACRYGHLDVVRALLQHEKVLDCINVQAKNGITALHETCCWEDYNRWIRKRDTNLAIGELLVRHGAKESIEMKDSLGRTPLHCACQFRSNKLAIWLSSSGAKWDTVAVDGMTALHWACRSVCSVKVVEELLQVLRDKINARDAAGRTPLHWACVSDYCTVAIVRRLLDNGAKIDALDNEGRTPLLYAVSRKTFDVVEHLWNTGLECHVSESYFSLAVFLCMQLKDVHLLQKMLALPKPEGMFAGELSPSITSELTLWVNRKKLALPQTRSVSLLYP